MRYENEYVTSIELIANARAAVGKLFSSLGDESPKKLDVARAYVLLRNLEIETAYNGRPITVDDLGVKHRA